MSAIDSPLDDAAAIMFARMTAVWIVALGSLYFSSARSIACSFCITASATAASIAMTIEGVPTLAIGALVAYGCTFISAFAALALYRASRRSYLRLEIWYSGGAESVAPVSRSRASR